MGHKLSVEFRSVLCADTGLSSPSSIVDGGAFDWSTNRSRCRKCSTPHFADDTDRPPRLDAVLYGRPRPDRATRLRHAWNSSDRSHNLSVIKDESDDDDEGGSGAAGFTVHRHPVAQSTDAVRGRVGHVRGLHVYEITWPRRLRGTHASVGVATAAAPLRCGGYWSLVGADAESWGWDIARNRLIHGGPLGLAAAKGTCVAGSPVSGTSARRGNNNCSASGRERGSRLPETVGERAYPSARRSLFQTVVQTSSTSASLDVDGYVVPDSFLLVIDADEGTLGFAETNGRYLGTAFRGLNAGVKNRRPLFPMISAVWGHAEISINYLGGIDPEPLSLSELSRRAIRRQVASCGRQPDLLSLPLPRILKDFVADR